MTPDLDHLQHGLDQVVRASPLWDGKVPGLQVTHLTERTMELRCLMSSRDSSENFDLRCVVREEMTSFLQRRYPDAFPTTRFATAGEEPLPPQPERGLPGR